MNSDTSDRRPPFFALLGGVVLGATCAWIGLQLRAKAPRDPDAVPAPPQSVPASEVEALRRHNELLKQRLAERTPAAAAKSAAPPAASAGPASRRPTWQDVGPRIRRFLSLTAQKKAVDKDAQTAFMDFSELLGRLAKDQGVTLEEAAKSPDGIPLLLLAMLEGSETPLTEAQRLEAERMLDRYRTCWKDYLDKRAGLSWLKRSLLLTIAADEPMARFLDVFSPDQRATLGKFAEFGRNMSMASLHVVSGTRESVVGDLALHWTEIFRLDERQKAALEPIARDFAEDMLRLQGASLRERLDAQIRAQERMAALLSLDEEQAANLDAWAFHYSIRLTDEEENASHD